MRARGDRRSRFGRGWLASLVALGACAGEQSIGVDTCPRDWLCRAPLLTVSEAPMTELSTRAPRALAPAWSLSHRELGLHAPGPGALPPYSDDRLVAGAEGRLWLFAVQDDQLWALQLEPGGAVLRSQQLGLPAALARASQPAHPSGPALGQVTHHALGPVVPVSWWVSCSILPRFAANNPPDAVCRATELLVFHEDASEPAVRLPTYEGVIAEPYDPVYRTAPGDALIVPALPESIQMIDLSGRERWHIRPLAKALLPSTETWMPSPGLIVQAGIFADGSLVIPLHGQFFEGEGLSRQLPLGLLRIGEQGALALRSFDRSYMQLRAVRSGRSAVAIDREQRMWAALSVENGDLLLLRIEAQVTDVYRVLREDYLELHVGLTGIDAAGTFYLTTHAGGRDVADQKPLLCSFALGAQASCYALDASPKSMQPAEAGVVYTLSAQGLARYDLSAP